MPTLFKKILIANRGEIAVRIIRACREMEIQAVAVYSEVDRDAQHVRLADEAHLIGPPAASESYLSIERILEAARKSGVQAIHPGYGFLSENPELPEACERAGIVFIGPGPAAMRLMGNKVSAREAMVRAGVPVVPGTEVLPEDPGRAREIAERAMIEGAAARGEPRSRTPRRPAGAEAGGPPPPARSHPKRATTPVGSRSGGPAGSIDPYPILLKAAAGGGGKGMRVVHRSADFKAAYESARSEARSSFGDPAVYAEKFIERPRHIEVQILADTRGAVVHLGERECTIQRRHQKLVEESPSPVVDERVRASLGQMAVTAARAAGYVGAGTCEFLRDAAGHFYFMEMNARLQVEHPVTEMVTGLDLVKLQIQIAAGEPIPFRQEEVEIRGSAIECRIYAEDPERHFLPSPGRIGTLRVPAGPGIRDDSGVYPGYLVPVHYDPMISKLVAWGRTREEAAARMRRALDEYRIEGVRTTIPFHQRVLRHPAFLAGEMDTSFIETYRSELMPGSGQARGRAVQAAPAQAADTRGSRAALDAGGSEGKSAPTSSGEVAVIAAAIAAYYRAQDEALGRAPERDGGPGRKALVAGAGRARLPAGWKLAGRLAGLRDS